MRTVVAISLLALTGCASWFKPSSADQAAQLPATAQATTLPARQVDLGLWPAIPSLETVAAQVAQSTPAVIKQAVDIVERSADAASARDIKEAALYEVVRYAAWAMGAGFLVFLLGGFVPIPGIRAAGGWTVALGAAIATLAPWLNEFLGNERVRLAGYAAFSILALAISAGGAWWFLDKVRDETRRNG